MEKPLTLTAAGIAAWESKITGQSPLTPKKPAPAAKILSAPGAGRGRGWRDMALVRQKIAIYAPRIAARPGFP